MTYQMRISQRPDGTDAAEADMNGRTFIAASTHGAEMVLARKLVEAGASDAPWFSSWPDGRPSLQGRSLVALAGLTVEENDHNFTMTPWRPWKPRFPQGGASPDGLCASAGRRVAASVARPLARVPATRKHDKNGAPDAVTPPAGRGVAATLSVAQKHDNTSSTRGKALP